MMQERKSSLIIILTLIIGIIIGIGGTSIYVNLKDSSLEKNEPSKPTEQSEKLDVDEKTYFDLETGENFKNFEDLTSAGSVLYNYLKQDTKDLSSYLESLSNDEKLILGGVAEDVSFTTIEENLIKMFGSTLGIEPKAYYCDFSHTNPVALYNYNEKTKKYEENEEHEGHGAKPSNSILNYKMKSIETENNKKIVTFYGMYLQSYDFTIEAYNEKNIKRNIVEELYTDDVTFISNKEYFADLLENHKEDFIQFKYTFEKQENNYVLVNFEKIS